MNGPLLVTGASGQFGQRVLHHLLEKFSIPRGLVIAASRTPEKLGHWAYRGVATRHANFDDEESMRNAFQGVARVLLISTDTDVPGTRIEQHQRAISAAEKAGVRHVLYTSVFDPGRSKVFCAPVRAATEALLASSTLPGWTILSNHRYFETLFPIWPARSVQSRICFTPAPEGTLADISREDLARAAALELGSYSTGKSICTLSGAAAASSEQATGGARLLEGAG